MQNWVKHTLRATIAGGGLLMLGTGVASAAENVGPDRPATPVDQPISSPAVSELAEALRQARPLEQLVAAEQDSLRPAVTRVTTDVPAAVPPTTTPVGQVYPPSTGSVQSLPAQIGRVVGDLREADLNSPLSAELDNVELPVVPILSRMEQNSLSTAKPGTPVHSEFEMLPIPVNGTVATDPLDAGSGTRVTAANTESLLRK
ncbi:hypothetical protein [Amycolatopsis sp. NPDC051071]|uniref:hypothetical protein n=1 Tax=Amycolatopsis sp. NPDC051071 TaxID=3154637 RepID=UPI0034497B8F